MKSWIKLLRAYDGQEAGAILEVEAAISRALIAGGIAEAAATPVEQSLAATATAEMQEQFRAFTTQFTETFRAAAEELRQARPGAQVEAGASETDKFLDTGAGFRSLGHFAQAVHRREDRDLQPLIAKFTSESDKVSRAASGMSESVDADGGILVPPTFSNTIWDRIWTQSQLMPLLAPVPIQGNSMVLKARNEDSRADGSRNGGIQAYWQGEAEQYKATKTTYRDLELRLKKLTAMSFMTDELLADGPAAEADILKKVPDEFDFKLNLGLYGGTGVGMPLGVMLSGARVGVDPEAGQATASIVWMNIVKMWNRLLPSSRARAVWLASMDAETALETMYLATGAAGGVPVYMPAGAATNETGLATLKGRPIIPLEQAEELGTEGDLVLADFTNYAAIIKGGIRSNVSIHLRFDYGEVAYRWDLRMDAQPYERKPLSPYKGSKTRSSFVSLKARP